MRKIKSLVIVGTRPEAIKMAILIKKLNSTTFIKNKVCSTGQHKEMLNQVFEFFNIKSDYDLDIMKENQTLEYVTSEILLSLRTVLIEFKPDIVFTHGDTTTCFASSLAAFYQGIKVAHVEAGLRTGNIYTPFPEELNRNLVSKIAYLNFAPTEANKQSLLKENINENKIFITGNTVIDSLLWTEKKVREMKSKNFKIIKKCIESNKKIILVTAHRRENIGAGLNNICASILEISKKFKDIFFVFSVHPNPKVSETIKKKLANYDSILLSEPFSYPDMVFLIRNSWAILTDSGGLQEEAPTFDIPVFVMRNETERSEAVDSGTVKLIGTNKENIIESISELYCNDENYYNFSNATNPYGDGKSVDRIINILNKKHSEIII